ncbi:MAG: transposase family protein [Nitrosomonadales bacterium]|nr:transposase family protein [Nitrosomonadales bacterium]
MLAQYHKSVSYSIKTDANGSLHFLLGILDHGSRALLHLQALRDKTTGTVLDCLHQAIQTYGKPKVIRTDNEACPEPVEVGMFTSRAFSHALKKLGIRHQRTDPGCPWQNGRIERLFGTLKQKLDQWQVPDFAQLNRDLDTFCHWYNHVRPHQNLDGKTPAEAWSGVCARVAAQQRGTHRRRLSGLRACEQMPPAYLWCTPCGCDPYTKPHKQEHWFEAWGGLLAEYCLRH